MKNLTIIVLMIVGTFWSSCNDSQKSNTAFAENEVIKTVNVAEFEQLINEKSGFLLDVRTPGEFASGNIPGSRLINVNDSKFTESIVPLDKKIPILVYCRSGKRSMNAAKILETNGFTSVYNLDGGFNAWSASH